MICHGLEMKVINGMKYHLVHEEGNGDTRYYNGKVYICKVCWTEVYAGPRIPYKMKKKKV